MREKNYNSGLRGVLFEAKHFDRMGPAIWLFGWLVLRETHERDGVGYVLGGQPVSYREIADETGFACKTLERWMRSLRRSGYIETAATQNGVIVRIRKAKKYLRQAAKRAVEFPQASAAAVNNLCKTSSAPADFLQPPLSFAAAPAPFEASAPQFRGGMRGQRAENTGDPPPINSRSIEKEKSPRPFMENRKKQKSPSPLTAETFTKATSYVQMRAVEINSASPQTVTAIRPVYASRQRYFDRAEAVARELRAGAGPEVSE